MTSELVKKRVMAAFNPYMEHFFELENSYKPDLYGPFWVFTTLIFILAASGNLATYI